MKRMQCLLALLLTVVLLMGCTPLEGPAPTTRPPENEEDFVAVPFDEMPYSRLEPQDIIDKIDACVELAMEGEDTQLLLDRIYKVYDDYYLFATNYYIAYIRYCQDLTDSYWEEEYNYWLEHLNTVEAALDQMLFDLADSPVRDALEEDEFFGVDFFDDYEGDSIWDETFTSLMDEESRLQSRYYELNDMASEMTPGSEEFHSTVGAQMGELFVELIALRQQIASYAGYDSYPEFAYDFYHDRDYTPQQTLRYTEQIALELRQLYIDLPYDAWEPGYQYSSESKTYAYVQECAGAMGGVVQEAFQLMEEAGLYDITKSSKKFDSSFEVYLMSYSEPFIFLNPTGYAMDQLTFAHEFGHFCNEYASWGTTVGVDVAEIFSQAMEYLSLEYVENGRKLTKTKMADSLCVFVEQAAYASFEHRVYQLEGEELTADNVAQLFWQVGDEFGFTEWGWDGRNYVRIPHFFTSPLYVISYVISNDAAFQIYQLELEEAGKGLALYEQCLTTQTGSFLAFMEEAGLTSPFAEGRLESVRQTLEEKLK